jgi:hypothetical protein
MAGFMFRLNLMHFSMANDSGLTWVALLLADAAMFPHECVVSVDLAGKSPPATRDNFQRASLSLILRRFIKRRHSAD